MEFKCILIRMRTEKCASMSVQMGSISKMYQATIAVYLHASVRSGSTTWQWPALPHALQGHIRLQMEVVSPNALQQLFLQIPSLINAVHLALRTILVIQPPKLVSKFVPTVILEISLEGINVRKHAQLQPNSETPSPDSVSPNKIVQNPTFTQITSPENVSLYAQKARTITEILRTLNVCSHVLGMQGLATIPTRTLQLKLV